MYKAAIILLAIGLAGCVSTETKNMTKSGNWFEIGQQDAQKGWIARNRGELSDLGGDQQEALQKYDKGYKLGLSAYCQPENAIHLGLRGKPYNKVCDKMPHGFQFEQDWLRSREGVGRM